jgi:hypothetical protein
MADSGINLPGGFGGLTRYNEEYSSYINLKPVHVIMLIVGVIIFRIFLGVFLG